MYSQERDRKNIQVFLSYARTNQEKVKEYFQLLSNKGFNPWMDMKKIHGGETWKRAIRKAIRASDFILVFLSKHTEDRRGIFQVEIKEALALWKEKLDDDIFLIPVRLEECVIPDRLANLHWIDLYDDDGLTKLMQAIDEGITRRKVKNRDNDRVLLENKASAQLLKDLLREDDLDLPEAWTSYFIRLAKAISALKKEQNWSNELHVDFIAFLLETVVIRNAEAFRGLSSRGEHLFGAPPVASKIADEVLSAQMETLNKDDKYVVISDFNSWQGDHLPKFMAEMKRALKRGVLVRRVFNLILHDAEVLPVEAIENILWNHLEASRIWTDEGRKKGYEVKIIRLAELSNTNSFSKQLLMDRLYRTHFGLFQHGEDILRFDVKADDLSSISFCREYEAIKSDLHFFNEVWSMAIPLKDEGDIKQIIQELRLKRKEI